MFSKKDKRFKEKERAYKVKLFCKYFLRSIGDDYKYLPMSISSVWCFDSSKLYRLSENKEFYLYKDSDYFGFAVRYSGGTYIDIAYDDSNFNDFLLFISDDFIEKTKIYASLHKEKYLEAQKKKMEPIIKLDLQIKELDKILSPKLGFWERFILFIKGYRCI